MTVTRLNPVTSNGFARSSPRAPPAGHFPALGAGSRLLRKALTCARRKKLSYSTPFESYPGRCALPLIRRCSSAAARKPRRTVNRVNFPSAEILQDQVQPRARTRVEG